MYFNNDQSNTNIDKEFKQNNNLSSKNKKANKYSVIIIIGIILVLFLLIILLLSNEKITHTIILNGENIITLYQGTDYIEPGYDAYNSKEENLTSQVHIESNLNTDVIGQYEIKYTIGEVTETRIVNVIEKSKEYTYIYLNQVNNNVNVYLKLGEQYTEPGYQVFNSAGHNLTNQVTIAGSVDSNKKGNYQLTYSVTDTNGVVVTATRTVIVMDSEINLTLDKNNYTNGQVTINAKVIDEYFDYMILPNNEQVSSNTYSYKVSDNGTYTFTVYNKKGMSKQTSITVKNIDKTSPTGTCSGTYKDGVSTISVAAKDNIGIDRYVLNGITYNQSQIIVKEELQTVTITIYDKANNTKNISCTLEDKNETIISDESITFSYQYVSDKNNLSYGLFTPSSATNKKPTPLIVWLHGSGEVGASSDTFKNSGLLKVLQNWKLHGFNAYVICPQLSYSDRNWHNSTVKSKLDTLLSKITTEKNIDYNKIVITGHSLGAQGLQYIAYHSQNYYSAMVVLSGYNAGVDIGSIKNIPTRGYVGTPAAGEDSTSYNYMKGTFSNAFGSKNLMVYNAHHGSIPQIAFTEDKNKDNKSDLIEWMLSQEKRK